MSSRLSSFLAGTRVLDLSRHLPGPLATLLLADMGAEVTKVESPEGDELRSIGPRDGDGRSIYFDAINAGKRSIRLDLKSDQGKTALRTLAADADVLIESFRPGVMTRLGLSAAALRAANPRLVYVAMSGYGQDGPPRRPRRQLSRRQRHPELVRGRREPELPVPAHRGLHGVDVRRLDDPGRIARPKP